MGTAHRRETMIALKAAHTAIRVARDVGYPQIDVTHVYCVECGTELDWQRPVGPNYLMFCPACGQQNEVPLPLRAYVVPSELPASQAENKQILYEFHPKPPSPPPEDLTMPRWLKTLAMLSLILGLLTAAFIVFRLFAAAANLAT